MHEKLYLRPVGLLYGAAAEAAIADGLGAAAWRAGRLRLPLLC